MSGSLITMFPVSANVPTHSKGSWVFVDWIREWWRMDTLSSRMQQQARNKRRKWNVAWNISRGFRVGSWWAVQDTHGDALLTTPGGAICIDYTDFGGSLTVSIPSTTFSHSLVHSMLRTSESILESHRPFELFQTWARCLNPLWWRTSFVKWFPKHCSPKLL